jgi:hypothetical protein
MPPRLSVAHRPDVLLLNCFHVPSLSTGGSQFVLQLPISSTVRDMQEVSMWLLAGGYNMDMQLALALVDFFRKPAFDSAFIL